MPDDIAPSVGDSPTVAPSLGDAATRTGTPDAQLLAAPAVAPPGFVLEGELGRGGMGVVYRARQLGLNRPVALKMILGDRIEQKHLIRFLAEAEAVASVKHPNVVEVYQFGEDGGRPYLAMEFCPGGSLRGDKLVPARAAELLADIADGVAAAHALGIVHRDLKPGNVLLAADGTPKVTDFGLAKRAASSSELTRTNAVMGTPAYMAPEQAQGGTKFVGPQADVWSLGVMLYEVLCGERPFAGDDTWQVLAAVMKADVVPPRKKAPGVPGDLELICLKCLEKEPHDRYPTAAELAADLRHFLAGEPVSVRPAGPTERFVKWTRRNRGLTAAGTATAAALLLGAGVATWQAVRASGEAARADREAKAATDRAGELAAALEAARREKDEKEAARQAEAALKDEAIRNERAITAAKDLFMQAFRENVNPVAQVVRLPGFLDVLKKYTEKMGDDRAERLLMLNFVGTVLSQFGRDADAIPILTDSLALRREHFGADHRDAVGEQCNLGIAHYKSGNLAAAQDLLTDALRRMRDAPAAPGPAVVLTLMKLGDVARANRQFDFARSLHEALVTMAEAKFPPDHDTRLTASEGLARTHLDGGNPRAAVALYEQTLAVRASKTGRDDVAALNAMGNLTVAYAAAGRTADAIRLGEETHRRWTAKWGPDDIGTIQVGWNLSTAYRNAGRLADAVPLQVKAAELHEKEKFAHRRALVEVDGLVDTLALLGRDSEIVPWLRKIIPVVKAKSGANSAEYAARLAHLGLCLTRQRRWADAEPVLRESLAIREKLPEGKGVAAWQVANTRSMLGGALLGQKKLAEAEPLLAPAHADLVRHAEQIPPAIRRERLAESLDRLVWLAQESNDAAAALKWQAEYASLPPDLAPAPRAR